MLRVSPLLLTTMIAVISSCGQEKGSKKESLGPSCAYDLKMEWPDGKVGGREIEVLISLLKEAEDKSGVAIEEASIEALTCCGKKKSLESVQAPGLLVHQRQFKVGKPMSGKAWAFKTTIKTSEGLCKWEDKITFD